ncbi:MAG: GWxTD domain-containing protein [Flavobacteriales bacterium]|jgi:GWxTD domain-containing protein|nr:GWxTD domain-containing protein [Flavobacteriales bacterium]
MKQFKLSYLFFLSLLFIPNLTQAQQIKASMSPKQYIYKDSLTFIDFYFKVDLRTLKMANDSLGASLTMYLKDPNKEQFAFIDRVKISKHVKEMSEVVFKTSCAVKPFVYDFYIKIEDFNNPYATSEHKFPFKVIDFSKEYFSDILLANEIQKTNEHSKIKHPFYKRGRIIIPKIQSKKYFYKENEDTLKVFYDIYPELLDSTETFYLESFAHEKHRPFAIKRTYSVQKMGRKRFSQFLTFPIDQLRSGNYVFKAKIINENKEVISETEVEFSKVGKLGKKDSKENQNKQQLFREEYKKTLIKEFQLEDAHRINLLLGAMAVRFQADRAGIHNIIDNKDIAQKQNYLISFWERKRPVRTEAAIKKFIKLAKEIESKYGKSQQYGYRTDRGRVRIQYGKPQDSERRAWTAHSKAYEIWHYHETAMGTKNHIFVFTEIDGSQEIRLLHSTQDGEPKELNWKSIIQLDPSSTFNNRQ